MRTTNKQRQRFAEFRLHGVGVAARVAGQALPDVQSWSLAWVVSMHTPATVDARTILRSTISFGAQSPDSLVPARRLVEVGGALSGRAAAFADIASVTRGHRSSITGDYPARAGNRALKRAFFLAAFAALSDRSAGPATTANTPRPRTTTPR